MKLKLSLAVVATALALAGCKKSDSGNATALNNGAAPIPQIAAPAGTDWTQTATITPRGTYLMGNPNAPVKLVEYASITCPHCAEFEETASTQLMERYVRSGQVSWEYRPYMIFPTDPGVFMLLHCLGAPAFYRTSQQLYATQRDWVAPLQALTSEQQQTMQNMPPLQRAAAMVRTAGLDAFFRQRGLPEAQFNQCLADQNVLNQLQASATQGNNEDSVTGTPTFIINGNKSEQIDWPSVDAQLRAAIGG